MKTSLPPYVAPAVIAVLVLVIGIFLWRNSQPAPADPNNLPPFLQMQKDKANAAPNTPATP